jgi:hypothetical protein
MDKQLEDIDKERGHEEWTCNIEMQNGHMDTHYGQAACTSCMDMQHGHAMWTSSMDMQHREMDMKHGHTTCSIGTNQLGDMGMDH